MTYFFKKPYGRDMPEMKYNPQYCEDLVKYMSKGYSNVEIAAKFGISEKCFYNWKKSHSEFALAYEIGYPLCFSWWMNEGKRKFFENENDKGYKFWQCMVRNMFGFDIEAKQSTTTNNIQIGSMNVLQGISNDKDKLLEFINNKLISTNIIDVVPVKIENNVEKVDNNGSDE